MKPAITVDRYCPQDFGASRREDCRTKRRGDFPCGISPPLSDFSKVWFGFQTTTLCHYGFVQDLRAEARVSRILPQSPRRKSLLGSARQHPVSRPLPESRFRSPRQLLVCSLLLEDLSSVDLKILPISKKARGFREFFDVEMTSLMWKCGTASVTDSEALKIRREEA